MERSELNIRRDRELLLAALDRRGLLDAKPEALSALREASRGRTDLGGGVFYYPRSFFAAGNLRFLLAGTGGPDAPDAHPNERDGKRLLVLSKDAIPPAFEGERFSAAGWKALVGPRSWDNYLAIKEHLPFLAPASLQGERTTIGCGDRLGMAGPGHIRAARDFRVSPVLAQLSMRELKLTGRTYPRVVKDAAFAALQEGFDRGFGADGDHLKNIPDIDTALDAGMPMITLDLTEVMDPGPASWTEAAVEEAFGRLAEPVRRRVLEGYAGRTFSLPGASVPVPDLEAKRCALMYWEALEFTGEVDRHLRSRRGDAYDLEVSIDETTAPTVPAHHLFIASELARRGVTVNSLAPRFIGEFQKGIDYIGDPGEFEKQFAVHCAIAKAYGGYKISIHSGSDKFSVYPAIGRLTDLRVHVKTAGTSWLEAVRAASLRDPGLFRDLLAKAYDYFPEALKLYHITPDLSRIPDPSGVPDEDLPLYLERPESRQLLHVSYGGLLNDPDTGPRLFRFLIEREELHYGCVGDHIRAHIERLGVPPHGR